MARLSGCASLLISLLFWPIRASAQTFFSLPASPVPALLEIPMKTRFIAGAALLASLLVTAAADVDAAPRRYLYAAMPGIRDYLDYGGPGLLVFDIDHGHKFVKRIKTAGLTVEGKPLNVKGICASMATRC